MTDRTDWLNVGLVGLLLGGVALAPAVAPQLAGRRTDDRVAELEEGYKKLAASQRGLDARVFHLEEMEANLRQDIARVLPQDARWVELARGGREQWEFKEGGRVQVLFEGWTDTGAFGMQVNSRAGEVHAGFRPGFTLSAVDDLGDRRRVYTIGLHRIELHRDGRPARGLMSVTVETK